MGSDDRPSEFPILFFDGVCGLCNASVDFVLRHERQALIRFCPLQSSRAAELLAPYGLTIDPENLSTFIFLDQGRVFTKSDAALRVSKYLRGATSLAAGLRLIPRALRDAVYSWVATRRYRWFGKRDACRLPTSEERPRFIT